MLSITTGSISPDFCKGDDEFQGLLGVQVGRSSTGNLLSPMSRFTHVFTTSISTLFVPCLMASEILSRTYLS